VVTDMAVAEGDTVVEVVVAGPGVVALEAEFVLEVVPGVVSNKKIDHSHCIHSILDYNMSCNHNLDIDCNHNHHCFDYNHNSPNYHNNHNILEAGPKTVDNCIDQKVEVHHMMLLFLCHDHDHEKHQIHHSDIVGFFLFPQEVWLF